MRISTRLVTSAALLMLGAAGASAQQASDYEYYVTGEGENRMVMSRSGGEGSRILPSENGQRPGQCPNGTFYARGDNSVVSCDDDSPYSMTAPETGMMMDDGQPFETGSMILSPDTTGTAAAPGTTPSVDQPLEPYAPDTGGSNNSGSASGSTGSGASGG